MMPHCVRPENRGNLTGIYSKEIGEWNPHLPLPERLLDFRLFTSTPHDDDYLTVPTIGQFAVFDCVTKVKAWFTWPHGYDAMQVQTLVNNHFASFSHRVSTRVWHV